MKCLLLLINLCSFCCMQVFFLSKSATYIITSTKGNKQDINRIYFLTNDTIKSSESFVLKYEEKLKQISLLSDTTLIAYYSVQKLDKETLINNFSPLRDKLSFNDLREREYKLEIQEKSDSIVVLKIVNSGSANRLLEPVIITLKLKTD